MRKVTSFILSSVASLALSTGFLQAATLQVDIQSSNATPVAAQTQNGWSPWGLSDVFDTSTRSNTFSYADTTDGTLDVSLIPASNAGGRNYGLENVDDENNLAVPDVWFDQYFFNNNSSGTLTITFNDLKAGTYDFTSYHYGDDLSIQSGDEGITDLFVDEGGGFVDSGTDARFVVGRDSSGAPRQLSAIFLEGNGIASISFTVANDNDPISIRYQNMRNGNDFGLNGFELSAIPETSSAALLMGVSVLALLLRRRR